MALSCTRLAFTIAGNPVSTYPLASVERPQIKTLQSFLDASGFSNKPWIEKTETVSNADNTKKPEVEALAEPPSSFLFLPGTVLLPQPNGGLYKPVIKSNIREKSVRVAKYRTP